MSKVGLKAIVFSSAQVKIDGNEIFLKGPKGETTHSLPDGICAKIDDKSIYVRPLDEPKSISRELKATWGMNSAILANKVRGVETGFKTNIIIVGLGYKALLAGQNLNFSLGYSHKIDLEIPVGISVEVEKTGQKMMVASIDKLELGNFCAKVKSLRPVEPYKGTGIFIEGEKILRKAGKTKKS